MQRNVVATYDYELDTDSGYKQYYRVNFCDNVDSDEVINEYRFRNADGTILVNFLIVFDIYLPKIKELAKEPTKILLLKDFITLLARENTENDLFDLLTNYAKENNINI